MGWMGAVGAAAAEQWFDEVKGSEPRTTELAPASAPEGPGDEPSPAEPALTEVQLIERATMGEASEEQIATLQERIRRMGRGAFWLRCTVFLTLVGLVLVGRFSGLVLPAILAASQFLVMAVPYHLYDDAIT
jgi:hypothetical protein